MSNDAPKSPQKILIVEDDPDISLALSSILEDAGYVVVTMDGTGDPLPVNVNDTTSLPDLILLDMLLSGQDGRELARRWKGQPSTRHIPIVMLSAHPSAAQEAQAAGANDFIAKPFEMDDLLAHVRQHLAH